MSLRPALLISLALTLMTVSGEARAAAPTAPTAPAAAEAELQARQSFRDAEAHFKAGLFTHALGEYQAGYELMPLPGFLINIAQCYRRLGDLTRARASYRKFILVAPDSPLVPQVKGLIAELDELITALGETPPTAGGKTSATSGPPQAVTATDGASAGLPRASDPETTVGASGPALVAVPGAPAASSTKNSGGRWWIWGALGGAVAVAAGAAFFALRTPEATTVHEGTLGTLRR